MTRFYLLLLLAFSTNLFCQTDGENLFDDGFLHEIRLTSVDTSFYVATKDYQMAGVEIDGVTIADIGFKRKGNLSGYPETNKFPIKIKTNKYVRGQEYDGIREFMLHMNYQDPTMLREKLTYDICAEMGLFSLRTAFAKVYLNDVYWGLYTIVEGKDEMYKQVFNNRDADAMESTDFGNMCYEGPNRSDYVRFGTESYVSDNGDTDRSWENFITMLDKVNNTPDASYVETVEQHLNIKDFFRYQAVNVYLLNMDSYIGFTGNQRYVYDTLQNVWQVTPWDFNASFGQWDTNNNTVTDYPLFPGFRCFGQKVETIPALESFYLDAMCELSYVVADTTKMYARIDALKQQIQDAVYEDERKVVTDADFDRGSEFGYNELFFENMPALKTVVRERFKLITEALSERNYDCSEVVSLGDVLVRAVDLQLFPNPVGTELAFRSDWLSGKQVAVKVHNVAGQQVYAGTLRNNSLDVSGLRRGMYICTLTAEGQTVVRKFVKE